MPLAQDNHCMLEVDTILKETDTEFQVLLRHGFELWLQKVWCQPAGTFKQGQHRVRMYVPPVCIADWRYLAKAKAKKSVVFPVKDDRMSSKRSEIREKTVAKQLELW